jgi:hypothetical protein
VGQTRLPVRKIREVMRLKADGFSDRHIAAAIGSARSTVQSASAPLSTGVVAHAMPAFGHGHRDRKLPTLRRRNQFIRTRIFVPLIKYR